MELHDILSHESRRPGFRLRDAAKLLYQSEFGGGHLIADPASALARLKSEMAGCEITDEPLISPIGGGFCRVNLAPAAGRISPETLFRIFFLSSRQPAGDLEVRGGARRCRELSGFFPARPGVRPVRVRCT